jgi:hypothetical protein
VGGAGRPERHSPIDASTRPRTSRSTTRRGQITRARSPLLRHPAPPGYATGLIGDVEVQVNQTGTVTIVEAARYVRICAAILPPLEGWAIRMDRDCIVLAEQVWNLPIGEEDGGRVLTCEMVRDDRT